MTNEIEYKGIQLPVKTDFSVISKVCNKFNYKFSEFTNAIDNPEHLIYLFQESLKRGHKLEEKPYAIKDQELEDVLSDNYADFMAIFNKDCLRMSTKKSDLQNATTEDKKKI